MKEQQIINLLNTLAAKLQGPAKQVWRIMVKQAYVDGYLCLGAGVLALIISYACIKLADEEGLFVSLLIFLFATLLFYFGISRVWNPEYHALINLMEVVGRYNK